MPALAPPSMQIGALPNGASSISPLPAGLPLQQGFNSNPPTLVQQVAGASAAAGPVTFTLSGITATKAGSYLVFCAASAITGAQTFTAPTGWTLASNALVAATLGGRMYVFPNNPGGITSVVITTLANTNGIACWFAELSNVYAIDTTYAGAGTAATYNASSTTPGTTAYTATTGPQMMVGFETDVTGQAYTAANVGNTWLAGTTATSTNGATNAVIRPFFCITTPIIGSSIQLAGTLAGALANGTTAVALITGATGALLQNGPLGFPTGAQVGWQWGALGGTKPGGSGGGQ